MPTHFKTWKKANGNHYTFYKLEEKIGAMTIEMSVFEKKASFLIGEEQFTVKHVGFWKSNIEIEDAKGNVVLKTYNEKWYANTSIVEFDNRKLKLIIRNNPLAEYAIVDGDKEILAYGLDTNEGKAITRIQTSIHNKTYLLDFLLWYLFVPIAHENMGENITFTMLLLN